MTLEQVSSVAWEEDNGLWSVGFHEGPTPHSFEDAPKDWGFLWFSTGHASPRDAIRAYPHHRPNIITTGVILHREGTENEREISRLKEVGAKFISEREG